jgi:hypothetical protein
MSTPPPTQPQPSTSAPNSGESRSVSRDAPGDTTAAHIALFTRNPDARAVQLERDHARNAGDEEWEDEIIIERVYFDPPHYLDQPCFRNADTPQVLHVDALRLIPFCTVHNPEDHGITL